MFNEEKIAGDESIGRQPHHRAAPQQGDLLRLDAGISALSARDRAELDTRYGSLVLDPRHLKFIDRLAADSRAVALNHTAGLSTPQQIQMALFALFALVDEQDVYKQAMKRMVRDRHRALYRALGIDIAEDPNAIDYYTILDLEILGTRRYGRGFVDWLLANKHPLEILFRLADEAGVVLLPGKGFGTPHPSARVSLANLNKADYARIGRIILAVMEEYAGEYRSAKTGLAVAPPNPPRIGEELTAGSRSTPAPHRRS